MNVRELIEKLSRVDPDLPVVMQQCDEPLGGGYEVLDVSVIAGQPDRLYHATAPRYGGRAWDYPQVWDTYEGDSQVVMLGSDKPWRPIIDGELAQRELTQDIG